MRYLAFVRFALARCACVGCRGARAGADAAAVQTLEAPAARHRRRCASRRPRSRRRRRRARDVRPRPAYGTNFSGRIGVQIKRRWGVYADLGGGFGFGGSISAGTGGGGVSINVADYWRLTFMGEIDVGRYFFLSLGPGVCGCTWGGVSQVAHQHGSASQAAYVADGYFPECSSRVGVGFGHGRNKFTLALENMVVFGTMTRVSQNASMTGADQSVRIGNLAVGWAPRHHARLGHALGRSLARSPAGRQPLGRIARGVSKLKTMHPARWFREEPTASCCARCLPARLPAARGPARLLLRAQARGRRGWCSPATAASTGFCVDPDREEAAQPLLPGTRPVVRHRRLQPRLQVLPELGHLEGARDGPPRRRRRPRGHRPAAREGCPSVAYHLQRSGHLRRVRDRHRARGARARRRDGAVTAGYITAEARREFYAKIDAANVDLKAFTEEFYHKVTRRHLEPVLETLQAGSSARPSVWLEITTLLIPGLNDSDDEIARAGRVDRRRARPRRAAALHRLPSRLQDDATCRATPPATLTRARADRARGRACNTSTPATCTTRRAARPAARVRGGRSSSATGTPSTRRPARRGGAGRARVRRAHRRPMFDVWPGARQSDGRRRGLGLVLLREVEPLPHGLVRHDQTGSVRLILNSGLVSTTTCLPADSLALTGVGPWSTPSMLTRHHGLDASTACLRRRA